MWQWHVESKYDALFASLAKKKDQLQGAEIILLCVKQKESIIHDSFNVQELYSESLFDLQSACLNIK